MGIHSKKDEHGIVEFKQTSLNDVALGNVVAVFGRAPKGPEAAGCEGVGGHALGLTGGGGSGGHQGLGGSASGGGGVGGVRFGGVLGA